MTFRRSLGWIGLLLLAPLLPACGTDGGTDGGGGDLAPPRDQSMMKSDAQPPDLAMTSMDEGVMLPDLAISGDLAMGDLAIVDPGDLSMNVGPDLPGTPDMAMLLIDMKLPDIALPSPDQAKPVDLALPQPDQAKPVDMALSQPDLAMKDLAMAPADMAKPPDLAPGPDMVQVGPKTHTVTVAPGGNITFSPTPLTIKVGDTVHWVWASGGHTVTSGTAPNEDNKFCSPNNQNCANGVTSNAADVYDRVFNQAGNFPYFCFPHRFAGMTGSIIVQ